MHEWFRPGRSGSAIPPPAGSERAPSRYRLWPTARPGTFRTAPRTAPGGTRARPSVEARGHSAQPASAASLATAHRPCAHPRRHAGGGAPPHGVPALRVAGGSRHPAPRLPAAGLLRRGPDRPRGGPPGHHRVHAPGPAGGAVHPGRDDDGERGPAPRDQRDRPEPHRPLRRRRAADRTGQGAPCQHRAHHGLAARHRFRPGRRDRVPGSGPVPVPGGSSGPVGAGRGARHGAHRRGQVAGHDHRGDHGGACPGGPSPTWFSASR